MRQFSVIPALVALALPLGQVHSAEPAEAQQEAFEAYNDSYNALVADHYLEAFVALYGESPLWIAPTAEPAAGLDVPRNTFQFIIDNEGSLTHTFDRLHVSDDGTQAVMIGTYEVAIEKVGAESSGTYLFVLEQEGDGWKIVVDMFNEHAAGS